MNHSQILPRLFVGSCPATTEDINHLKADLGITAILNLQTDQDLDYWDLDWPRLESHCREWALPSAACLSATSMPGPPAQPPRMRGDSGRVVAGRSHGLHPLQHRLRPFRSVAIAYLFLKQHRNLDESMEQVTKWRSCSPNIESIITSGDTVAGVYEDYWRRHGPLDGKSPRAGLVG